MLAVPHPSYTCRLCCLSETISSSLPAQGLSRCCDCASSETPSSQLGTWPIHCALLSQCQCHSPAEALTTKPEILTSLSSLSQNRFILYESLPDCTSSLSVVYGQLCARFKPQLGCQLRGMGHSFPHSRSSALGTVSGDCRLWLGGGVASSEPVSWPHAACAYSK